MIEGKGYTSVYEIIERVFDMYDTDDVSFSVLVRHIGDAIALIGALPLFKPDVCTIKIENFKGQLPSNIYVVNQVRYVDKNGNYAAMVNSTDTFFMAKQQSSGENLKYEISQNHIHTKFEEGTIEIAYHGFVIDEEGYPLITNDETIKMALEAYVLERIGLKLLLKNKIDNQKYQLLAQERNFYMGAAERVATMPSIDKMESISRMMTTLLERPLSHSRFFKDLSNQEYMRIPNKRRFI